MSPRAPESNLTDTPFPSTTLFRSPVFSTVDLQNWGIGAEYRFDMAGGTTDIDLDHDRFDDQSMESEEAHARVDGEWDESEADRMDIDASDAVPSSQLAHQRSHGAARMEFCNDYRPTKRDIDPTSHKTNIP